jgi:hypothetical protein
MHFHIMKMYKDKKVNKNVKNIFLSMCDVKLFYLFCSNIVRIIATGPCITNQLRNVNTICRRSWYIAAHIWKIYDFKIEVVPFIINFSTELTTVVSVCWSSSSITYLSPSEGHYFSRSSAYQWVRIVSLF